MILQESKEFLGFFEIPNYSRYVIDKSGTIINKKTNTIIKGSVNPAGYLNYRLTDNNNKCLTIGRHRILCMVFKPIHNYESLYVNHINGIKGNDFLDNLEWVTPKENVLHAGEIGITSKCIPIKVRDVDTGEVVRYKSIKECALHLNMTKDAIIYRIKIGEGQVFPERKQYRPAYIQSPWVIPTDIENNLLEYGSSKKVLLRNLISNEIKEFDQLTGLAKYLGIAVSTASQWVTYKNQPVLPGFIQLQYKNENNSWRKVDDMYEEFQKFSGRRVVKVINTLTEEIFIYPSAVECAKTHNLKTTTLNYRLKSDFKIIYNDGCLYGYYS